MRTFGRKAAACLELGSLARNGGRCDGKLLAISHEGLTGYCSLNGYHIQVLAQSLERSNSVSPALSLSNCSSVHIPHNAIRYVA
jgi:hypothetical protein